MDIDVLIKKGKVAAAAYIHSECLRTNIPATLYLLLDKLLNPLKSIDDWSTIEWCQRIMAGGLTIEEFTSTVQKYDDPSTCGLVWTANFVAYRCRTCGISPCMSLCAECFKRGNHSGHDFNMFRSQAGGACDCGDTNVMKESGFCHLHGIHQHNSTTGHKYRQQQQKPPVDLLSIAYNMMPRLIYRLIIYMRENSNSLSGFLGAIETADKYINMLYEMSGLGAAMRHVIVNCLISEKIYKEMNEMEMDNDEINFFLIKTKKLYEDALCSLANPEPPDEYKDIPSLQKKLIHITFLEELVFWTAKFEFPQKIVCLLLNLLPDAEYKESFTRAFVLHYSRISQLLVTCTNPDMLSNRVVHVSVQLFSNEKLAVKMADEMYLLHVMVISLKYMMSQILMKNSIVDCAHLIMKDHCYWPLVSDLNNILSHKPIAIKFLQDDGLINMWMDFLTMFQGMNMNHREMNQHIEFEPSTYYAAFSAELEASASPMWALITHLKDNTTAHLTLNLLQHCRTALKNWIDTDNWNIDNPTSISFHLPLHRYYSIFLRQAIQQGININILIPPIDELLQIIKHPLRVQTCFYEIISGLWVRNGLQIKGQAMTYVQCHFCNSMVDADIYLLQLAMGYIDYGEFLNIIIDCFHILPTLSLSQIQNHYLEQEQEMLMLENCLIFISTLITIRTSLGIADHDLVRLEMITLLCMGDKTHSQLMELMPERCGNNSIQSKDFEEVLADVADYKAPNFEQSGNMLQGMYIPKAKVWNDYYDPIYILLRAVHRREFQTSMDRFTEHMKSTTNQWPPYRLPKLPKSPYNDPRKILNTRVFHAILFILFYKSYHANVISDQIIALAIHLLHIALSIYDDDDDGGGGGGGVDTDDGNLKQTVARINQEESFGRYDMAFQTWFDTDSLFDNLKFEIDHIIMGEEDDNTSNATSTTLQIQPIQEMETESFEQVENYFQQSLMSWPRNLDIQTSSRLALMNGNNDEIVVEEEDENQEEENGQIVLATTSSSTLFKSSQQRMEIVNEQIRLHPCKYKLKTSIIKLLIQLYTKINRIQYIPYITNIIGTSSYYISNILDKINKKSSSNYLINIINELYPNLNEIKIIDNRRKAADRRKELMDEMAKKSIEFKKFMKIKIKNEYLHNKLGGVGDGDGENHDDDDDDDDLGDNVDEWDCVICNEKNCGQIGLIGLIQSSCVLDWRRFDVTPSLPTSDIEILNEMDTFRYYNRMKQLELMKYNLIDEWKNTYHIQTCGHYIHYECLKGYLQALKSQQRQHNISVDRGEYSCPFCRQLSNTFLPLFKSSRNVINFDNIENIENEILKLCKEHCQNPIIINEWSNGIIDEFTNGGSNEINSVGIARTNLEIELIELQMDLKGSTLNKRSSCIVPIFQLLSGQHRCNKTLKILEKLINPKLEIDIPLDLLDGGNILISILLMLPKYFHIEKIMNILINLINTKIIITQQFLSIINLIKYHFFILKSYPIKLSTNILSQYLQQQQQPQQQQQQQPQLNLPTLLILPINYDLIFNYYQRKYCKICKTSPKDPSICLICSELVCMRDICCKKNNIFEATQHSIECGNGTGIFLSINSSTIVIIRGKRACLWGSIYLDEYGEEDRELKRGKPLYLSTDRYNLLQLQWITHRFDHTAKKWIFHRDTL